ncbi:MAG TPA: TRAP transporter substrate-binding protein [Hyphomonadaceae bacterium]|nr:TRAP transporter substrate-binding protein [Hyphomonadaceae bacterium]
MPRREGKACELEMITRRGALAGFGAAAAATACSPDDAGLLTEADVHRAGYPTVEAVKWMGEEITRATGGRLKVKQFPSGQLGAEDDSIGLAQYGAVDFARVNFAAVNNLVPETRVLCLPFAVHSMDHLHRVVDSDVGEEIRAAFDRVGLVGLAIYDAGARCFYNVRGPIHEPGDLKGLKIRSPMSDVFLRMFAAMGANPTPLAVNGVFQALSTHLIDGAENNWPTFESARHLELARYWSETEHSYSPEILTMSKRSFGALSKSDQDIVVDAAARSVPKMREHWARFSDESKAKALKAGVQSNVADRPAFRRAVEELVARETADATLADLYKRTQDLSG